MGNSVPVPASSRKVRVSAFLVYADQRMVLQNSCLATVLTIQEGLNNSSLSWRAIVYTFLEDLMNFLGTGKYDYTVDLLKIISVMKILICAKKLIDKYASILSIWSGISSNTLYSLVTFGYLHKPTLNLPLHYLL